MRKRFVSGYILLIVLVFMQIFSMLGLASFLSAKSILKQFAEQHENVINLHRALKILNDIEHESLNSRCLIPNISTADISILTMSWWHLNACKAKVDNLNYYFIIEFLGHDPCSFISKNFNNQLVTADFYRITLVFDWQYKKMVLQSTIANANDSLSICEKKMHKIKLGRQMWREL